MQSTDAAPVANAPGEPPVDEAPRLPRGPWGRWPWLTFVLPFAIYMIWTAGIESRLETAAQRDQRLAAASAPEAEHPAAADAAHPASPDEEEHHAKIPYDAYPLVYTLKIITTVVAMVLVIPGYLAFRPRVSGLAILVGVVGIVVWVGICKLQLEQRVLVPLGLAWLVGEGARPGFNPLVELQHDPRWAYGFLAIRLFGLAIVVPIIEEFFLRGFLMRYVMDVDWFKIPFGKVDRLALITGTAFPMLMHPGELFAAMAWFSMVTWLMLRTRNIWDCVAAHAVTNALLGAYVLATGEWQFM